MKNYDYKTARTIAREGCELTITASLSWLSIDITMICEEFANLDREYLNIDMAEYSRITEGWC